MHNFLTQAAADLRYFQVGSVLPLLQSANNWTQKQTFAGEVEIDGDLNHDGGNIGFFGAPPANKRPATTDIKDVLVTFGFLTDGGATNLNLDGGILTAGGVVVSPLRAKIVRAAAQTITDNTATNVDFDTESHDTGGWWDAGVPTDIVVPAGTIAVSISAAVSWTSNNAGFRRLEILKNGASIDCISQVPAVASAGVGTLQTVATAFEPVVAADVIRVRVQQDRGGDLNISRAAITVVRIATT